MLVKDAVRKKWFKSTGMGTWEKVEMEDIAKGEYFRGYTVNGRPLLKKGRENYVATYDPYLVEGRWTIEADLKKM
jgi:hypothetical protein